MFGFPIRFSSAYTELDRAYSWKLISIWTEFAKTGKMPNLSNGQEWPVANWHNPEPKYVEVTAFFERERKFEFEERCEEFWKPLLELYKR